MAKVRAIAGSSIVGNIVGALTLTATIIGLLMQNSSTSQLAAGGAPVANSTQLPWVLIMVGVIGMALLLPSWVALFQHFWPSKVEEPDWWLPFKPASNWASYPYKQRWNQTYTKQTVELDGYDYVQCVFDNVTFYYDGTAPVSLRECQILQQGPVQISSKNNVVAQTFSLAVMFYKMMGGKAEMTVRPS